MQERESKVTGARRVGARLYRRVSVSIPCLVATLALSLIALDQASAETGNGPVEIPESAIEALIGEVNGIDPTLSATRLRRAYKGCIREAQTMINEQPAAPNRYQLLHAVLTLQRRLLDLDRSERARADLFETCELLAGAPDRYAELRFDADMLLSERRLSQSEATSEERAVELRRLVEQYRDTPGEFKSLKVAMALADRLYDLEGKLHYFNLIQQRFAENRDAIAFIRGHIGLQRMDIIFAGQFERNDGVSLNFPYDRMGHAIIAVFWSTKDADYNAFLSQLKAQQDLQPDRFEIYSFNLDELDDAGTSILESAGLSCSAMKLPGGMNSDAFRTYALKSPQAILINEYGRTMSEPEQLDGPQERSNDKAEHALFTYPKLLPSHVRYQMQLQSLFNGDFFVQDDKAVLSAGSHLPAHVLSEIASHIPAAPFRYRLSPEASYRDYSEVETLASSAIETYPDAPDLWRVRNYRIIALMGMWSAAGDLGYLDKAVAASRAVLSKAVPADAGMVARFCLARHALREGTQTKKEIITQFVEDLGGATASDMVHAAASVLALNANAVDLHEHYRELFLRSESTIPYSVLSFLRNRYHRYYLFQGDISYLSLGRLYKHRERRYIINNDISVPTRPFPSVMLKKLDGSELTFPPENQMDRTNMTVMIFLEPPADGALSLDPHFYLPPKTVEPVQETESDKKGKKRNKKRRPPPQPTGSGQLYTVSRLAETHVSKGLDVILAFLSDDVEQVKALNEEYGFPCEVVLVPSGLNNPIVRSLDIFSADTTANIYFVRRDGTMPWHATGFRYRVNPDTGQVNYQTELALRNHIYRSDLEAGYQALKARDYEKAKELFSGPYISEPRLELIDNWRQSNGKTEYHKWTSSQHYGRALAHIGLAEWDEALKYIDKAKIDHMVYFRHDDDRPCSTEIGLHKTHALILDNLGRKSEAKTMRSKAVIEPTAYPTDYFDFTGYDRPYEIFNEKLIQLNSDDPE